MTTHTNSDTPRTDAEVEGTHLMVVDAEFCRQLERELNSANAILDWLADERIFDGIKAPHINGQDIDLMTIDAFATKGITQASDEQWKLEWRKQFRIAIMKGFQS